MATPISTGGSPKARRGLTNYQQRWTRLPRYDERTGKAKTKTFVKARRIGGSFAVAVDSANMCAGYEWLGGRFVDAKPFDVVVVSATFEQAKEIVAEVGKFCDQVSPHDPRYAADVCAESVKFKATGAGVYALPCKSQSIRGYTGASVWDETVFADRPEEIWAAIKIVAGSNLREPRGYPVSLVTTPWAQGTFAHRLFTDPKLPFHRLQVDIFEAVRDGFPADVEQLRAEAALEEIWQVEYCCQWLKGGGSFFDLNLLSGAQRSDLPNEVRSAPSYWGIDIGRTHDLTAAVEVKHVADEIWITSIFALRDVHFDDQIDRLSAALSGSRLVQANVDQGLMGRPVLDALQRRHGNGRISGVNMSSSEQELMAVELRTALERGQLRIYTGENPAEMRALCTELGSIKAKPTNGHRTTFATPRDQAGHGDRAWAAMLGITAAAQPSSSICPDPVAHDFDNQPCGF